MDNNNGATGLCKCGCGGVPPLAMHTNPQRGLVKGQPKGWITGHQSWVRGGKYAKRVVGQAYQDPVSGYILEYHPDHPCAAKNGRVMQHRIVMEKTIGRFLLPSEVVHHKDRNRQNNDPDNLEIISSTAQHQRLHHREAIAKGRAWSPRYNLTDCQRCGTAERRHFSGGYCRPCWFHLYFANGNVSPRKLAQQNQPQP